MEAAMAGGGRGRSTMRTHIWCMLLVAVAVTVAEAWTEPRETAALRAVKAALVDPQRSLRNWEGDDPCGVVPWTGVFCEEDAGGVSHVTEVRLMRLGLGGTLAGDVGDLQQLRTLNLMWNQVGGPLPASIGNLQVLELLLLSGNNFMGPLPPEMSRLSKMTRLQIDSNSFTQSIPSEFTNLTAVQHFHMNNNFLSGVIPPGLGNLPDVIHIILDNNLLTGKLPPDLLNGSSPRLQIVQVDNNLLDAQQLPASIGPHLVTLSLRNCSLFGSIPGLAGGGVLSSLQALDLRDNRLTGSFPDLSSAPNLSTVALSGNSLAQNISSLPSVANLTSLQALLLAGNNFTGSLDTVQLLGPSRPSEVLVDLQNNNITGLATVVPPNVTLLLAGNEAICIPDSPLGNMPVCQPQSSDPSLIDSAHTDGSTDCQRPCSARAVPKNIGEECLCLSPVTAGLRLMSPSFTLFNPYQREYEEMVAEQVTRLAALPGHTNQTVSRDQVYVRNYTWTAGQKLRMDVQIFPDGKDPSGQFQQQAQADELYTFFALWKIVDRTVFGPYELLSWDAGIYGSVQQPKGHRGIGVGAVVGIVVASVTASSLAVALVALYCFRNRKFRGSPIQRVIVMGRSNIVKSGSSSNALLNVTGVQAFSFDEMCIATEGFSNSRKIGQGGYGKVYSGVLEDGVKVAIKRAQEGSLQGSREFYTEIELLSRVHHRNLVRLLGFCDDQGEQMLVYEYISGGTLRDYLSPTSTKPPLPFEQRLRIALGSARGIAYLHNEANPPIFHRDIKASNILLDDKGNAKVADFGLSKLAPATDMDGSNPAHVSTVVKGTPGYLDPEYFLTHKLTDKSDVYSFGVVLLELITGMHPISHGKNIVREVYAAYEAGHVLAVVDTRMGAYPSEALEPLVRLALSCCRDSQEKRPSTLEVVRDLEDIWRTTPTLSLVSSESPSHQHQPRRSLSLKSGHDDDSFADATDVLASRTVLEVAPR